MTSFRVPLALYRLVLDAAWPLGDGVVADGVLRTPMLFAVGFWLTDVLARLVTHPAKQIDELLPPRCATAQTPAATAA